MPGGFWKRFGALFAAGAAGVVALVPATVPQLRTQLEALEAGPLPSDGALLALALAQPLVLLAMASSAGAALAHRVGLRSHLARWAATGDGAWGELRRATLLALAVGATVALVVLALDALTLPLLGAAGETMGILQNRTVAGTVLGVLYGGVTEEVLLRWGLMTLLAWGLWRLGPRRDAPGALAFRVAIFVSALLFGAAHLPAVAVQGISLTPAVVSRIVGLNAVAGLAFGWLYWRRSLEAAMLAHAGTHVVWSLVALLA